MNDIQERRMALGWTRERLAAEAGVSLATISSTETGRRQPLRVTLDAIERALSVAERQREREKRR